MGQLDPFAVQRQQPCSSGTIQYSDDVGAVGPLGEPLQSLQARRPPGVLRSVARRGQPHEHPPGQLPLLRVELSVELLRGAGKAAFELRSRRPFPSSPVLGVAGSLDGSPTGVAQSARWLHGGTDLVHDTYLALRAGTVRAAVPVAIHLDTLADDLHPAVLTDGRHAMDRTSERVENVTCPVSGLDSERQLVVIPTHFATCHEPHRQG